MAVGGRSKRGVLTTCNYEARKYGVHSAMPTTHALRLCPDLVVVPGRMEKYKEASIIMREVFSQYTDLIEPLSLDEAYLDVTDSAHCSGSATLIAQEIRKKIQQRLNITVSAGVAPCKFLAKVASDWNKPDGLFVIEPKMMDSFIRELPVNKIHGVGKVTTQKLNLLGIYTCADIREFGLEKLSQRFGIFGQRLFDLAQGKDKRKVRSERTRKSLSVERTFFEDLPNNKSCQEKLPKLLEELDKRMGKLDSRYQVDKAFVKVKFNDFSVTTLERVGTQACEKDYRELIQEALGRRTRPIRLLGLGVRFKTRSTMNNCEQLELFPAGQLPASSRVSRYISMN